MLDMFLCSEQLKQNSFWWNKWRYHWSQIAIRNICADFIRHIIILYYNLSFMSSKLFRVENICVSITV